MKDSGGGLKKAAQNAQKIMAQSQMRGFRAGERAGGMHWDMVKPARTMKKAR